MNELLSPFLMSKSITTIVGTLLSNRLIREDNTYKVYKVIIPSLFEVEVGNKYFFSIVEYDYGYLVTDVCNYAI
jgi:hypothetical protein